MTRDVRQDRSSTAPLPTAAGAQAQQTLATALCLAEERERRRLAKELHGQALQTLAAARITLQVLGDQIAGAAAQQLHRRTLDLVSQTERELRALTTDLAAQTLAESGLGAALKALAERSAKQYGVPAGVTVRGSRGSIPLPTGILLCHAARELLANAGRHAKASQVRVRLTVGSGRAVLSVEDDGLGFDVGILEQESQEDDGLGLRGLRARLRQVGGSLDIRSQAGQGTTVTLTVPADGGDQQCH